MSQQKVIAKSHNNKSQLKVIRQSCQRKLTQKRCVGKLHRKVAKEICIEKLCRKNAQKSYVENLHRKVASGHCKGKLHRVTLSLSHSFTFTTFKTFSLSFTLSQHAEQLLFSCLCSKVAYVKCQVSSVRISETNH